MGDDLPVVFNRGQLRVLDSPRNMNDTGDDVNPIDTSQKGDCTPSQLVFVPRDTDNAKVCCRGKIFDSER